MCSPQIAFEYRINARLRSEAITIDSKYRDKKTGEPLIGPTYPDIPGAQATDEERNRIYSEIFRIKTEFRERAELVVGDPSKPITISQQVPPKGVESFRVKFHIDGLKPHDYYIFSARAVIQYDAKAHIETPTFKIQIRQSGPN